MKNKALLVCLCLSIALVGCKKFDYREQYTGNFTIEEKEYVGGSQPHTNIRKYPCRVHLGKDEDLVFDLEGNEKWIAHVDEHGVLTGPPDIGRTGSFAHANLFNLETAPNPIASSHGTLYLTGRRDKE